MTRGTALVVLGVALLAPRAAGTAQEWASADPGRRITLPADHRSHPEYRLEWWYYTGNLTTGARQRFGFQLTFFRIGVHREPPTPSRWAVRDLYMAHLAITDIAAGTHVAVERLNRAGIGWAGASTNEYHVWNDDWSVSLDGHRHRLRAASQRPAVSLDLTLEERGPPVLHGDEGFSRKGSAPGNASYYYSLTRMPARGSLRLGERLFDVSGAGWMDHEFGTTFLERDQAGWDWFSMHLDDGRDLMLFQLRGRDGSIDPRSSGTIVMPDGTARALDTTDLRLEPQRRWRSPASGGEYPVDWRIVIPGEDLDLRVRAALDGQELNGAVSAVSYWEGAVNVDGTDAGRRLGGVGYLEMTGYGGRPLGVLMSDSR